MTEYELCADCQNTYNELVEALRELITLRLRLTLSVRNDSSRRRRLNLRRRLNRRCAYQNSGH